MHYLCCSGFTPHSVCWIGASDAFSISFPEARIRDWGRRALRSPTPRQYIDRQCTPNRHDFRLFVWMLVTINQVRTAVQHVFQNQCSSADGPVGHQLLRVSQSNVGQGRHSGPSGSPPSLTLKVLRLVYVGDILVCSLGTFRCVRFEHGMYISS